MMIVVVVDWMRMMTMTMMQTELHAEHIFPFLQPVDWWAVGVVSYELLTGHCPFTAHEDEDYFASIIRFVVFIYFTVT